MVQVLQAKVKTNCLNGKGSSIQSEELITLTVKVIIVRKIIRFRPDSTQPPYRQGFFELGIRELTEAERDNLLYSLF